MADLMQLITDTLGFADAAVATATHDALGESYTRRVDAELARLPYLSADHKQVELMRATVAQAIDGEVRKTIAEADEAIAAAGILLLAEMERSKNAPTRLAQAYANSTVRDGIVSSVNREAAEQIDEAIAARVDRMLDNTAPSKLVGWYQNASPVEQRHFEDALALRDPKIGGRDEAESMIKLRLAVRDTRDRRVPQALKDVGLKLDHARANVRERIQVLAAGRLRVNILEGAERTRRAKAEAAGG